MRDVVLANLNNGFVRHEYMRSLVELQSHDSKHDQRIACYFPKIASGNLGIHRNEPVEFFLLYTDAEVLVTIDSDIEFPPEALDNYLSHLSPERPIISGLYYNYLPEGIRPMMYRYITDPPEGERPGMTPFTIEEVVELRKANALAEADGVGAGFLVTHRDVLMKMYEHYGPPQPWFGNDIALGVANGEDFTFCLRARELGFPIHVELETKLTHVKPVGITLGES